MADYSSKQLDEKLADLKRRRAAMQEKASRRARLTPGEIRVVERFEREIAQDKRRRQLDNLRRGEPADGPKPKPMTRDQKIAHHREQIQTLKGILDDMPQGYGRRVMQKSLEMNQRALRGLTGHEKPSDKYYRAAHENAALK